MNLKIRFPALFFLKHYRKGSKLILFDYQNAVFVCNFIKQVISCNICVILLEKGSIGVKNAEWKLKMIDIAGPLIIQKEVFA